MDPRDDAERSDDLELLPDYEPPKRNLTTFIIIGAAILIILIVISVIFLLVRTRTDTSQPSGDNITLTPQPTPTFYQMILQDLEKQEVKLNEIGNDLRELEAVFTYKSVNFSDIITPPPTQTPEFESQKTEIAKARAELEIDRRIAVFDKLIPRIESLEKLSSAQRSLLANEVNSEINFLSSLKSRIAGQNNFSLLTADINTLTESFKNFQVLVPKVMIAVIADKINVFGDSFTEIADALSQKTEELSESEKDVSQVQITLGHMLFVLGDGSSKAEAAVVTVFSLSPTNSNNNSVLLDAKRKIQASHQNLTFAVTDAKNIVNSLTAVESGRSPSGNFFNIFELFRFQ